jgi:SanA protein
LAERAGGIAIDPANVMDSETMPPPTPCPRGHLAGVGAWLACFAVSVVLVVAGILNFTHFGQRSFYWHVCIVLAVAGLLIFLPALRRARPFTLRVLVLIAPAFLAVVLYANTTAVWASRGRLFDDAADVPHTRAALVFGTTSRVQGRENLYFRYRIDAAVEVWEAGKVDVIIVSGDNRTRFYNEPRDMRQALIARGVPNDRIVSDFAGLRTLDSVVRAKEIFGADPVLFISQRFQNERAIYLAKANGIEAFGYNARDVSRQAGWKTRIREVGARVKMWLDVRFLNTRPRHLGDPIDLPE